MVLKAADALWGLIYTRVSFLCSPNLQLLLFSRVSLRKGAWLERSQRFPSIQTPWIPFEYNYRGNFLSWIQRSKILDRFASVFLFYLLQFQFFVSLCCLLPGSMLFSRFFLPLLGLARIGDWCVPFLRYCSIVRYMVLRTSIPHRSINKRKS